MDYGLYCFKSYIIYDNCIVTHVKGRKALKQLMKLEHEKTFPTLILKRWIRSLKSDTNICPCKISSGCLTGYRQCMYCARTELYGAILRGGSLIKKKLIKELEKLLEKKDGLPSVLLSST